MRVLRTTLVLALTITGVPAASAEDRIFDELVGLCFYRIAEEVCNFVPTDSQRKKLDAVQERLRSAVGTEAGRAEAVCAQFLDSAKKQAAGFCTPELRIYFFESLKGLEN